MTLQRTRRSTFSEPITKSLTWDIDIRPVSVDGNTLDNYQSLVRNDNRKVLAVTKKSYHPATNEKFVEVVSKIHEFTGFDVEGYSVFHEGRKVIAFLKNNEKMKIGDFDSQNYMVVGNSFDCSSGFFTGISNVVVRCTNQLTRLNLKQNIRHNNQINMKLDELVRFYKDYVNQENQLKKTFELWNQIEVDQRMIEGFVDNVLEIPKDNISTLKKNSRESLNNSINAEIAVMGKNRYGLLNGLTHYSSHVVKSSNKMFGNSLGHSYRLNDKGFKFINQLVS